MLKLVIKDLKLFFTDTRALALTFAVPISLITLFAYAFGGAGRSKHEVRPMQLTVVDEDKTDASKNTIAKLDSLKEFEVMQTTLDTAEKLVMKGDEAAIFVFHKGFNDSLSAGKKPFIEVKYDAAKETEVSILTGSLTGSLMGFIGNKFAAANTIKKFDADYPDMDSGMRAGIHAQILRQYSAGDKKDAPKEAFITATPLVAEKENSPGLIQAVSGTAIMMLLFAVVGVGTSMLDEKQEGTLKKLLYSPISPNKILFGKMIYANAVAIFQLTIMFLYAKLVFGLDIFHHLPALVLMILATAYACSSFGVLLASFSKTRQQVQGFSTLIILVMSCIGGSMIPVFIMPDLMRKMAVFSVNYWGIQGFYDIFWRMFPITNTTFLSRILVLLLIGTGMNAIATMMFRKNILNIAE